jgi:hypothetical protein
MPNKNKAKGNRAERQVADLLTRATSLNWSRVPNSGAFIGGSNVSRINSLSANQILLAKGDLIPPDEYANVYIEVKSRNGFPYHQLFANSKELDSWLNQCYDNYFEVRAKLLLIVFKITRQGQFVVFKKDQLTHENEAGLDYFYKARNEWYRIAPFSEDWFINHSKEILELCQN